jgi:hypothetical protein
MRPEDKLAVAAWLRVQVAKLKKSPRYGDMVERVRLLEVTAEGLEIEAA